MRSFSDRQFCKKLRSQVVLLLAATAVVFAVSGQAKDMQHPAVRIDLSQWPSMPRNYREPAVPRRLLSAQRKYDRLIEDLRYEDVLKHAIKLVDIAAEEVGVDHVEYAIALSSLGAAYFHVGEYPAATISLEQSLIGIEAHFGNTSEELIGPLAYLGTVYQRRNLHADAIYRFKAAQRIAHVLFGESNPYQIKLVYPLAESAMALGDHEDVEGFLRFAVSLATTEFGVASKPETGARLLLAEWFSSVGMHEDAIYEYRKVTKNVDPADAGDSRDFVRALEGLSVAHLHVREASTDRSLSYQKRVLDVMEDRPRDFSSAWRILSHVRMADLNLLFGKQTDAWDYYGRAWSLSEADKGHDWEAFFSEPKILHSGAQLPYKASLPRENGDAPFFLFEFDIRENGRPGGVVIVDGNLHGTYQSQAVEAFRNARFRPRIADGKPQMVEGSRLRRDYSDNPPPGSSIPTLCIQSFARNGYLGLSSC